MPELTDDEKLELDRRSLMDLGYQLKNILGFLILELKKSNAVNEEILKELKKNGRPYTR